jgi:hypothetical protein
MGRERVLGRSEMGKRVARAVKLEGKKINEEKSF